MLPPELGPRVRVGDRAPDISQAGKLATFDAVDTETGAPLLVCALKAPLAIDPEIRRVARHGLDAVARLDHPGIAKPVVVAEDEGRLAFAIPRVDGVGVSRLLREGAIFTEREVASAGRSLLDALAHAHARGVCFGNIKSTNVVLCLDRRSTVIVGLPKPPPDYGSIRHVATYVGVPHECAPELLDRGVFDARADLYGVGLVLYEMCAGVLPFRAQLNFGDVVAAVIDEGVPPLTDTLPDVAPGLAQVIARAVARDPSQRFASAREMAEALSRAGVRGEPLLSKERLSRVVRDAFPTPIAAAFAAMEGADHPQTQVQCLVSAAHVMIQMLAFAALSSAPPPEPGKDELDGLDFGRPPLGTWVTGLRLASRRGGPIPELADAWRPLDALVHVRNEVRHGVSTGIGAARRRLQEARPLLDHALTTARFLRKYPLFAVERCDLVDDAYVSKVWRFRGARGGEERESIRTPHMLSSGRVYLATPALDRFIGLYPFVLHGECENCSASGLFLYESAGDERAHYGDCRCGQPYHDEKAVEELERRGLLRPT
jgi:hypothetical protein